MSFLASYEISKIIAKAGKPHNIGETVILPAVSAIISSVMKQNEIEITNSIALSSSSVSRRIDEMVEDVEKQLIAHLEVKKFALQLDESTSRDNEAILLAYVRFNNEGPQEECFFLEVLRQTQKVKQFLRKLLLISRKTISHSKI
ncbi:zinc finger BED domain-containing protein 5-like [Artemia franciscana]|uniref:zinc finger BED domain-containing protein 5-like n=1 Tax=Artemia franciscana TaxID=6661 RepID=UPI0032D9E4FF